MLQLCEEYGLFADFLIVFFAGIIIDLIMYGLRAMRVKHFQISNVPNPMRVTCFHVVLYFEYL